MRIINLINIFFIVTLAIILDGCNKPTVKKASTTQNVLTLNFQTGTNNSGNICTYDPNTSIASYDITIYTQDPNNNLQPKVWNSYGKTKNDLSNGSLSIDKPDKGDFSVEITITVNCNECCGSSCNPDISGHPLWKYISAFGNPTQLNVVPSFAHCDCSCH